MPQDNPLKKALKKPAQDIGLPNESGTVDPRIAEALQAALKQPSMAQPKDALEGFQHASSIGPAVGGKDLRTPKQEQDPFLLLADLIGGLDNATPGHAAAPVVKAGEATEGAVKRLFRVEPKDLGDMGASLEQHLPLDHWKRFLNERGRLFGDNLGQLTDYGHGEPTHNTYYVDVPKDVAESIKRQHSQTPWFSEYLMPDEWLAKKQLLPGPPVQLPLPLKK